MILANGVVRTMDPSLPSAGALAIAGDLVAGGVGTHEWALPTPDRVDLGGRCVLPAFTDSHVHFPTWSLAQSEIALAGVASLAEALARIGDGTRGSWIRGRGWRDADWPEKPTAAALDAVTGETPAALWSKDYHSLWLNTAALARADGELQVPGGVVERDDTGKPTGILREESAWQFRERFVTVTDDEWVAATRAGIRLANTRGVAAIHDKDGWLGAPRIFGRIHEHEGLTLRVWQSVPHERITELTDAGIGPRLGDDYLRLGYLKAFMDGTLGSQTAWMLDGSGVSITTRRGAAGDHPRRRGRRLARRCSRDRRPRKSRGARRLRGHPRALASRSALRHRIEHAQCLAPEDVPRFAELGVACSVQFSHAPSDRDLADRFWGERPPAPTRSARCWTPARSWQPAPTRRSRSSIHLPASAPR